MAKAKTTSSVNAKRTKAVVRKRATAPKKTTVVPEVKKPSLYSFLLHYPLWLLLVSGALMTLAFAPFFVLPLAVISPALLVFYTYKASSMRQAAWRGWLFGFSFFVTSLYWISYSLFVEIERFWWLVPFAVSLIPAVLAGYTAAFSAAMWALKPRLKTSLWLLTTLPVWLVLEWLRAHLFTGFPWNLLGYSMMASDMLMQPAYYVSVYGLSALVWLAAMAVVVWLLPVRVEVARNLSAVAVVAMVAALAYGAVRLHEADANPVQGRPLPIRIVQPNIPQKLKWAGGSYRAQHLWKQAEMTQLQSEDIGFVPKVVIWPESAIGFPLSDPIIRQILSPHLPQEGYLMLGTVREEGKETYNSIEVMRADTTRMAHYDKHQLVPFGEYIPLRNWLPFLDKITDGAGDFDAGPEFKTLRFAADVPEFLPLVCYEVIFPDVTRAKGRPGWIVTVTNDAWFGESIGPQQHFQMARLRAVEMGIPLVRAANTGISAVVDKYGRVQQKLGLGEEGVIDATLVIE